MFPIGILEIAPMILAMRIVVATLPNGDVERTTFLESEDGVRANIERTIARSEVTTHRQQFIRKARYTWKIEEERRSVLMALPGRPTGVTQQAFSISGWIDVGQKATDPPRPTEVFRFYAPTRDAAQAMRDRLKKALG